MMCEGRVGDWISVKERAGLRLYSIQFFRPSIDRDPVCYNQEIRLSQNGPILVLGFKER